MKLLGIVIAVCLLASVLLASACASKVPQTTTTPPTYSGTPGPVTGNYTDDLNRNVTITGVPQRLVSLSPSNTEMVYALGLQDRLVGVTSYDNYPPEAASKTVVSDYSTVDMEKIVAARPDLVLADSIQKTTAIPALEKLGIPVYAMSPDSMDGIFKDLLTLGQISGKRAEASALVSSLQTRVKAITDETANLTAAQKPRVLYITWHDPIWTAGSQTMIEELITLGGATNIASDLQGYVTISLEAAVQRNPQVILVMSSMGTNNESLDFVKSNAQFQATDALKNNQVFEVDADIFGRTTPRIVDGLETLAKMVHPELFK
jgi:iron complex transport system substrate-binding protein